MSTEDCFRSLCDAGFDPLRPGGYDSAERRRRRDRLADLCARFREACDTSDYPDASPPRYQAAAAFRRAVDPDDVCAVIDELGERR